MKAIVRQDGRLVARELPLPVPGPRQVLIRVAATSVNPLELMMKDGYGDGLFKWLRKGKAIVPGLDGAGIVTACGDKVRNVRVGDRVMAASMPFQAGFCAEYALVHESKAMPVPAHVSLQQAAALPYAGLTMMSVLSSAGLDAQTARGRQILVHGGSGGIGHLLIQVLDRWGAEVITTCSSANAEWVKTLGADHVIDYRREDFSKVLANIDVVINTIAPADNKLVEAPHFAVLRSGGHYVSLISPTLTLADVLGAPLGLAVSGGWMAVARGYWLLRQKHHHWAYFDNSAARCRELSQWLADGLVHPQVGNTFPLTDIDVAYQAVQNGPARGKVVLIVDDSLEAA